MGGGYVPPAYWMPEYGLVASQLAEIRRMEGWPSHTRRKVTLGFHKDTGKGARLLYKYIGFDVVKGDGSIDRGLELKKARDMLVDGALYLSSPGSFNDPDEFRAQFTISTDAVRRRRWVQALCLQQAKRARMKGYRRRQWVETQTNCILDHLRRDPNAPQAAFEESAAVWGVSCFAEDARNALMWSHYARGHKGICFQLDPSVCLGVLAMAHPVTYSATLPTYDWPDDKAMVLDALLTKSVDWAYEREHRILSRSVQNAELKFDARAVTAVILGRRFDLATQAPVLRQLLSERENHGLPPVRIYKAVAGSTGYNARVLRASLDDAP